MPLDALPALEQHPLIALLVSQDIIMKLPASPAMRLAQLALIIPASTAPHANQGIFCTRHQRSALIIAQIDIGKTLRISLACLATSLVPRV